MFTGAITAMISPFRDDQLDERRLQEQVNFQIDRGIEGLVPCGTTGESPTLSHDEHERVIDVVVEAAAGRVPVIAGAGSNATAEALRLARHARTAGADATLQVTGYYNKPSQEGMYRHFMTIADAVDLPMVLYNIPGRCVVGMTPATIARLAEHPNIVAVKEATGSLDAASEIAQLCDLTILSGDDSLTLPLMSVGARGVISVMANLVPAKVRALTDAAASGDLAAARAVHAELFPLFSACLKLAVNPVPIKAMMAAAGRDTGMVRLPLVELDDEAAGRLRQLLADRQVL